LQQRSKLLVQAACANYNSADPLLGGLKGSSLHSDAGRDLGAAGQAAAVSMWIRTPSRCHSGCGCSVCGSTQHYSSGYRCLGLPLPRLVVLVELGDSARLPAGGTGCCCTVAFVVWAHAPCVSGVLLPSYAVFVGHPWATAYAGMWCTTVWNVGAGQVRQRSLLQQHRLGSTSVQQQCRYSVADAGVAGFHVLICGGGPGPSWSSVCTFGPSTGVRGADMT
jgi:hypothetical protein